MAPEQAPVPLPAIKSFARRETYHNPPQTLKTILYPQAFMAKIQ